MEITFDKRNYRKHSEKNKKRIRKSLTECGAGMLRGEKVTRESRHKKSGAEDSTAESDKVELNASL